MERKRTALSEKNLRESHVSEGRTAQKDPRFLRMSERRPRGPGLPSSP